MDQFAEDGGVIHGLMDFADFIVANAHALLAVLLVSLSVSLAIHATRRWHVAISGRAHMGGQRQALHLAPTPRIGGLAVMAALTVGAAIQLHAGATLPALLVISALPVFLAGLAEDVFHNATPAVRLLAAAASGLIAAALTGVWLDRTSVPLLDALLGFAPLGVLFTIVATAGIAHAFNLVDGLNGLSSGIAMVAAVSLGAIALAVDDREIAITAGVLLLSLAGFWLLNYPLGCIFLGDAGAYTIGHVLGWLAVLLAMRNPEITPFAMLLVFLWPLKDTLFAIWRRWCKGMSASAPDRLHFHHVAMRMLEASALRRRSRTTANAAASALVLACAGVPSLLAVATPGDGRTALILFLCIVATNIALYGLFVRAVTQRGRLFRPERLLPARRHSGHRASVTLAQRRS